MVVVVGVGGCVGRVTELHLKVDVDVGVSKICTDKQNEAQNQLRNEPSHLKDYRP